MPSPFPQIWYLLSFLTAIPFGQFFSCLICSTLLGVLLISCFPYTQLFSSLTHKHTYRQFKNYCLETKSLRVIPLNKINLHGFSRLSSKLASCLYLCFQYILCFLTPKIFCTCSSLCLECLSTILCLPISWSSLNFDSKLPFLQRFPSP